MQDIAGVGPAINRRRARRVETDLAKPAPVAADWPAIRDGQKTPATDASRVSLDLDVRLAKETMPASTG
ncbi:MAG: hypothetical protein GX538_02565 [Gammaproteobacteria bacterium]|nr:hypothetical protein [Gammaproteobacteria bacterium]